MEQLLGRMEIYTEKLSPGSALFIRGLIEQKLLSLSLEWDGNMQAMGLCGCWDLWDRSRGEVLLELSLGKAEQKRENRAADGRGNCLSILLPWYSVSWNVPVPPDLQRMRLWRKDILPCLQLAAEARGRSLCKHSRPGAEGGSLNVGPDTVPFEINLKCHYLHLQSLNTGQRT